ncbi:MAG: DUF1648 domain-containing protein [Planctomycetota bacterium]
MPLSLLRLVLGLLIAGQVALAIALWPELPERIPLHFDAAGWPDGFGAPDVEWFVIPGLLALFGAGCGYGLPLLARHLARTNSGLLNVPDRERFRALPEEARVRAVAPLGPWLCAIACELQLLTAFLVDGTWRIATGRWQRLPPALLYGLLAVVLATAIGLAVANARAVRRECAAAAVTARAGGRGTPR